MTDKRVLAHQWYGQVFQDWTLTRLSYFCTRNNIKNTDLKEQNLLSLSFGEVVRKDIEQQEGLLPESFEGYQIVESGNIIVRLLDLQNDHKSLRSALVRERGIITSAYVGLVVDSTIAEPRFVNYSLRAMDQSKYLYSLGAGVRQTLKADEFLELPIPLPDLATQRRIADRLDRETGEIDSLVKELDEYVGLLEKRRSTVVSLAVSQSEDGKLFQRVPLSVLVHVSEGLVDPLEERYSELPLIAPNHIEKNTGKLVHPIASSREQGAISGKGFVRAGQVVYSKIRPALNKAAIAEQDSLCSADMYPLDTMGKMNERFLLYALIDQQFVNSAVVESARVAMPKVNRETLGTLRIPLPPFDKQLGIADRLDRETAETDALVKECTALKELLLKRRQVLITDMVTGKVEV